MNWQSRELKWAAVLIVVGLLALLNNFGVWHVWSDLWRLWPILLILWGVHLLRKRGRGGKSGDMRVFGDTAETTDSPYLKRSSAFGDITIRSISGEIAGGSVSTVFGDISIDLTGARSVTGYGQLDLHTVFGDITVVVPGSLPVVVSSSSVFGEFRMPDGISDGKVFRSASATEGAERLRIHCSQVFGDVKIETVTRVAS